MNSVTVINSTQVCVNNDKQTHVLHSINTEYIKAHLHPATATSLRHRCVITPKSNLLFWCCSVTPSDCDITPKSNLLFWCCTVTPSDCDVTVMLLGNRFCEPFGRDVVDTSLWLDVNRL